MNPGIQNLVMRIIRILALPLLLYCGVTSASDELPKDAPEAARYTYDYLFMIDALIRHDKYQRARVELDALLERVKQNPNETALARQAYGYLSIGLNDYAAAIEHFLFAIESGALPAHISHNLRYTLAQLMYQEEHYREGLEQIKLWFEQTEKPNPESRVLLASLHYGLKQWREAIKALKLAIAAVDSPQESWYQMLVGLYFETKQFKKSVPVLQTMLTRFPGKSLYWQQLSDVLLQLGRVQKSAAILSLAAERNLIDEAGLLRLAKLYLQLNTPLDAAELLTARVENGDIKTNKENLNLLVDAWLLARDQSRALQALERLAEIDKSGKPQLRSGRLLMELEHWQAAASQLEIGLRQARKPVFDDWLLLGSAHYRLENRDAAKSAFESALGAATDDNQRELVQRWLDYLVSR
jgi:tetratricopeptide (TPR) repeat protein